MKKYKNVLSDLDGTLTNPGVGITNSVRYALENKKPTFIAENVPDITSLILDANK